MDIPTETKRWRIIPFGLRKADGWIAFNFTDGRICVNGICLRQMSPKKGIGRRVVAVFASMWSDLYFMESREDWGPDDYFIHAAKTFGSKGITKP